MQCTNGTSLRMLLPQTNVCAEILVFREAKLHTALQYLTAGIHWLFTKFPQLTDEGRTCCRKYCGSYVPCDGIGPNSLMLKSSTTRRKISCVTPLANCHSVQKLGIKFVVSLLSEFKVNYYRAASFHLQHGKEWLSDYGDEMSWKLSTHCVLILKCEQSVIGKCRCREEKNTKIWSEERRC
jgi:hypothetical protein